MKKGFTIWIPDDSKLEGIQIAISLKTENDRSVTLFQETPEQLREHNEWLFRMNGAAVPVENGQAMAAVQEKTREEKK